jgi:hypothetical protein
LVLKEVLIGVDLETDDFVLDIVGCLDVRDSVLLALVPGNVKLVTESGDIGDVLPLVTDNVWLNGEVGVKFPDALVDLLVVVDFVNVLLLIVFEIVRLLLVIETDGGLVDLGVVAVLVVFEDVEDIE